MKSQLIIISEEGMLHCAEPFVLQVPMSPLQARRRDRQRFHSRCSQAVAYLGLHNHMNEIYNIHLNFFIC